MPANCVGVDVLPVALLVPSPLLALGQWWPGISNFTYGHLVSLGQDTVDQLHRSSG